MRRHGVEGPDAAVAERAAHLLDLVRFRVERIANHKKDTCGAETRSLRGDSLAGRGAEYDLVHLTEEDATRRYHELLLTFLDDPKSFATREPGGDPNLTYPFSQDE